MKNVSVLCMGMVVDRATSPRLGPCILVLALHAQCQIYSGLVPFYDPRTSMRVAGPIAAFQQLQSVRTLITQSQQ